MSTTLRKEFLLSGLDCAHCSEEIQHALSRLDPDVRVSLNFATRILSIESAHPEKTRDFQQMAESVIQRIEPGVRVIDRTAEVSPERVYLLVGLDCAHCAEKIEREIRALPEIESASVDFASQKLFVSFHRNADVTTLEAIIPTLVRGIESDVKVILHSQQQPDASDESRETRVRAFRLVAALLLFAIAFWGPIPKMLSIGIFGAAYLTAGYDVLWKAIRNILRGALFDENFLMTLATFGALAIGQYPEATAVMVFYQLGELFQHVAVNRSRRSIQSLMDIKAPTAIRVTADGEEIIDPESVHVGDRIRIRPGDRIPVDGTVIEGNSTVDISALTGESLPKAIRIGDELLSGAVNLSGVLDMQATRPYSDSTVARILHLVENAASRKAPTEQFITRFARIYTPAVVLGALFVAIVPPLLIPGEAFHTWLYRALIFLVISCPCALVISIPLGFFGGIGAASRSGILIKGSNYLEALNAVDTIVFDKTGTLTEGRFTLSAIQPEPPYTSELIHEIAAHAERWSAHPIARSITESWAQPLGTLALTQVQEIPGKGVTARLDNRTILVGNRSLMEQFSIALPHEHPGMTEALVAIDGNLAGTLSLTDAPRADAPRTIQALRQKGISRIVMLTGDTAESALSVSTPLGITEVFSQLLPEDKVNHLEELMPPKKSRRKVLFVGDGINDAPVLARADIGVAMGGLGSDAAIESADIVLMTDEPYKIVEALDIARETRNIVLQNIAIALGVKAVVLVLGAGGLATLWEAVFADVGVALIAILNAMRLIHRKGFKGI